MTIPGTGRNAISRQAGRRAAKKKAGRARRGSPRRFGGTCGAANGRGLRLMARLAMKTDKGDLTSMDLKLNG